MDGVTSYADDNGHGTHVAGTVAAAANGEGIVGVAPKVNLYAVKVMDANGNGRYSDIIKGIEWAIDNKINIINMSFGGTEYSKTLEKAVAEAQKNNILLFSSAGNDGKKSDDTITYPAKFKQVVAVGAVDQKAERADFSSVGTDLELVAPGVDIQSTSNTGSYQTKSGTSMASPHAAGVAALLWSKDLSVSAEAIRGLLDYSATELGDSAYYGNGLVNAHYALDLYDDYLANSKKNVNKKIKPRVSQANKPAPSSNPDSTATINGVTESYYLDSPHPYTDNYNSTWRVSKTGASQIRVHFSYIDTESNFDYVRTSVGDSWTGNYSGVWSSWANSSYIDVTLTSDGSVTKQGFRIDQIEYVSSAPTTDDHGNSMSAATTVSLNSAVSGSINYAGDEDWFRFTPSSSGNYTFETTGSTDTYGYLYNSSGTQLISNDDAKAPNFSISYSLTAGQTYYVKVRHYSSTGTGAYSLLVTVQDDHGNNMSSATAITVGTDRAGTIDYGGDEDWFRFTAPSSGSYTIESTGSTDTYGYLLSSSGTQLAYNDDGKAPNFFITYNLTAGQTYYVRVRHYSSSGTGCYAVRVTSFDEGNTFSTATSIGTGTTSASIGTAGDIDYFSFVAPTTAVYTFESGGSTDVDAVLYDSNQVDIQRNGDYDEIVENFRISAQLTAGQRYYLEVAHMTPR